MNKNEENIRLAILEDIPKINVLYRTVIDDLHNVKNITFWNDIYPFCEFEQDIKNKDMYVIDVQNEIIGSFAIIKRDDPHCHSIDWNYKTDKFFFLVKVAINPSMQGKGFSNSIMNYIIKYGIDNNYEAIRLTVHKDNIIAISLYEKYGFIKGDNNYYTIGDRIFYCYEKKLN